MAENVIIYRHPQHGEFPAHPYKVDEVTARYVRAGWPLSLRRELRADVEERTGLDFSDVYSSAAFLIILASFESEL